MKINWLKSVPVLWKYRIIDRKKIDMIRSDIKTFKKLEFEVEENNRVILGCRKYLGELSKKISGCEDRVEQMCERCADALNELEEKYGIVPNEKGGYAFGKEWRELVMPRKDIERVAKLLKAVKLGYMAMDENGEHHRTIGKLKEEADRIHTVIEHREMSNRWHFRDMDFGKEQLWELGISVDFTY